MNVDLSAHYSFRQLIRVALPSIVMMVVSSLYSIVDGLFVARFAGVTAFASVSLVFPALMLLGTLGVMIGTGGSALVSKIMGEGQLRKAQEVFSMLVRFLAGAGAIGAVLLFVFIRPLAMALGADEGLLPSCVLYGRICAFGLLPQMLQMAFQSFYMTAEKPQLGTAMSVACGITNVVLDALFVALLGWGLAGAAIATVTAEAVGGFFPMIYFRSARNHSALRFVRASMDWRMVKQACLNGISEYVSAISGSVISVCYNWQLMRLAGEMGVAAYGTIMYVAFIFISVFMGYNIGVAPLIGYQYGAQNRPELRSLFVKSICFMALFGLLLTLLAESLSAPCVRLFVGDNEALFQMSLRGFRLSMLCFMFSGINTFVSSLFTALNNGLISACASFLRTLVFEMLCVFTLPLMWGLDGVWLSMAAADLLSLVVSVVFVLAFRRRYGYL